MKLPPDYPMTVARVPTLAGTAGVFHTVGLMRRMVNEFKADAGMIHAAVSAIYLYPEQAQFAEAGALYNFVRDHVRYVRDPVGLESLAIPPITLQRAVGDCDDQATLLATLLEAVGYPTRFVIAGYQSRDYEHVYLQTLLHGQWVSADPIEKSAWLGWEPPNALVMWTERV